MGFGFHLATLATKNNTMKAATITRKVPGIIQNGFIALNAQ